MFLQLHSENQIIVNIAKRKTKNCSRLVPGWPVSSRVDCLLLLVLWDSEALSKCGPSGASLLLLLGWTCCMLVFFLTGAAVGDTLYMSICICALSIYYIFPHFLPPFLFFLPACPVSNIVILCHI